jgi:hypothetical protein
MPMRDYYLTLSSAQTVLSTGSTASNTPFDTGLQISSLYGQSPFQSSNLNAVPTIIGQSPKKFFFQVSINSGASGGTASVGLTIALQSSSTAAAGYASNITMTKLLKNVLTAAATPLLCKIPLPEMGINNPLKRYLKGLYTIGTGVFSKFKLDAELTVY